MKAAVSHLEIFAKDLSLAGNALEETFDVVGDKGQVYDWRHTNKAFFNAVEVERNVMFLILTLIIIHFSSVYIFIHFFFSFVFVG